MLLFAGMLSCSTIANAKKFVAVYRWYNQQNNQYRTVAAGECDDAQLVAGGWTNKTFIFKACKKPRKHTVAVYSWYNELTGAYISIADDEFTDDQMHKNGYAQKHLQYYALTSSAGKTVTVYRWLKNHGWTTIPDNGSTDFYANSGFRHKTFQYYAFAAK